MTNTKHAYFMAFSNQNKRRVGKSQVYRSTYYRLIFWQLSRQHWWMGFPKSFGTIWDLYLFSLFWASADFLRTWRKHQDCEPKIREAFTTSWCRPSRLSVTAEAAVATVVQVQKSAGHTHTRVKTTAALMKWTVAFDSQTPQFPSSDNCQITRTTTKHSLASKLGH